MKNYKRLLVLLSVLVLALTSLLVLYFGAPSWETTSLMLLRAVAMFGYLFALSWAARQAALRPMFFGVALAVGALLFLQVFSFPGANTTVWVLVISGIVTFWLARRQRFGKV